MQQFNEENFGSFAANKKEKPPVDNENESF